MLQLRIVIFAAVLFLQICFNLPTTIGWTRVPMKEVFGIEAKLERKIYGYDCFLKLFVKNFGSKKFVLLGTL